MDEVWIGVVLALCVGCVAFLAHRMEKNANALRHELALSVAKLDSKTFPEMPDFEELKESLEDLPLSALILLGQRVPQAGDHLMAMAQQWFQIKMAKQMNGIPGLDLLAPQDPNTQENPEYEMHPDS